MIWPSERRAMYGGSLKPESSKIPISSMSVARRGTAAGRPGLRAGGASCAGGASPARADRPAA